MVRRTKIGSYPGQLDSYWLAESFTASNPAESAVLYFIGCAPAEMRLAVRRSTETKRLWGPELEE
jgi:hypothetical protein